MSTLILASSYLGWEPKFFPLSLAYSTLLCLYFCNLLSFFYSNPYHQLTWQIWGMNYLVIATCLLRRWTHTNLDRMLSKSWSFKGLYRFLHKMPWYLHACQKFVKGFCLYYIVLSLWAYQMMISFHGYYWDFFHHPCRLNQRQGCGR